MRPHWLGQQPPRHARCAPPVAQRGISRARDVPLDIRKGSSARSAGGERGEAMGGGQAQQHGHGALTNLTAKK